MNFIRIGQIICFLIILILSIVIMSNKYKLTREITKNNYNKLINDNKNILISIYVFTGLLIISLIYELVRMYV